jgi:capsular exopolysaccharide synthesis family protein
MSDAGGAADALQANIIIQTQANILQSDVLALRTIDKLHMEDSKDFRRRWNPVGWLFGLISPKGVEDKPGVPLKDAPGRRANALKVFEKNLKVKPVSGTQLIEIDYSNPDPQLAAAVVNELAQALIDYNFETRYDATNQASTWLAGQLSELRKQSQDLQSKVVNLQRESGVYSMGTSDAQGREQAYSGVLDQLQQATLALTQAKQNRILKESIARAVESGDAEMLSGLAGNNLGGGSSMNNSLALIQNLRQQQAQQMAALKEAEAKFGTAHPKLEEMRANLSALDHSIRDEIDRIKGRAESDYKVALQQENATQAQYDKAKVAADKLNDKAIEYAMVRQEADQSRGLYEDLLKRLREAGVLEGLKSSNITIVDPASAPAKPTKPNVPLYMAGALCGGVFFGCMGALLLDSLNRRIDGIAGVEELTGGRILGALPFIEAGPKQPALEAPNHLATLNDPHSTFAEAVRAIRTSILLTGSRRTSRVILVTSSIEGEGKTTVSANLANILAQSNRRVLLVDMDMRRGTMRNRLALPFATGLSDLLAGQQQEPNVQHLKGQPNLSVLLAGTPPPNPSELLDSYMEQWISTWRETYDFVVLDAPPLLPVSDARIVHPWADTTILLARSGHTERAQLERSYAQLSEQNGHFVGVVLNGLRPEDESYYGYYGYRNYAYHYGEGKK